MSGKRKTELQLLLNETQIGIVRRNGDKLTLEYNDAARSGRRATMLSLSMPLSAGSHSDPVISNFLWGLLPDNEVTISAWAQRAQVSPRSVFQLIGAYGEDLPGALQAGYADDLGAFARRIGVRRIPTKRLADFVRTLMQWPGRVSLTEHGGKFSLPGAQPKKALNWISGSFYDPQGRTPSTHILKPPVPGLEGQVANEHFCLRLASELGIRAARSQIVDLEGLPVIVVERFDRLRRQGAVRLALTEAGGEVIRIHQEDMCQALGVHPSAKYQNQQGPGISSIMTVLAGSSRAVEDRSMFMRAIVYNFVIGGTDAHAKNYAILHLPGATYRLAPLYDVISALPYEDRHKDRKLAMSVNGEYRYDRISPLDWRRQAAADGYDEDLVIAHIRDILGRIVDTGSKILRASKQDGLTTPLLDSLLSVIAARVRVLMRVYGVEANS